MVLPGVGVVGLRVHGGPSRRLRTTSRACGGGGVGVIVRRVVSRAVRVASVRLIWRVRGDEAFGSVESRVVWLGYVCCRCHGFCSSCDYAGLRARGGWEGWFVCQFACRVFAIVGVSAVVAWLHVCVLSVSSHVHVCRDLIGRVVACLRVVGISGIFGIFACACLQGSHWLRGCVSLGSYLSSFSGFACCVFAWFAFSLRGRVPG